MIREMPNKSNALGKVLWFYNIPFIENQLVQKIVCPFHGDVNPSMIIDFTNQNWYCFGCGRSGDAKQFVKYMEDEKDDLKSLHILYDILSTDKCSNFTYSPGTPSAKQIYSSKELYSQAWDYYYGLKKTDWSNPESEDIESVKEYMKHRGFNEETLIKCRAKYTYEKGYPIVFPMFDNNKFRGWVERTTDPDIEKKRKYLYNTGFSRATTLVGEYGTKDYVFIVEGYMDRLKFIQYGIDNVVAILGWKISKEQIEKLKKNGINKVICALDNDECGIKGWHYLEKIFDTTRFCYLKGIKDPGEMTKSKFNKMFRKTMKKYNSK